jgi:hypothetical protein
MAWQWDGEHYLRVAREGYAWHLDPDDPGDSVHFAFLYPALIRLFGGSGAAAVAINNLCSLAAVGVVAWHWGPRPALALALFPSWLVYGTVGYSEGLFVLLAAVGIAFVERGRLVVGGLVAGLAACARYLGGPALLLAAMPWPKSRPGRLRRWLAKEIAALRLDWWAWLTNALHRIPAALAAALDWLGRAVTYPFRRPRHWIAFAIVAATGTALAAWMWWQTGKVLGYYESQKPWGGAVGGPWEHFDWLLHGWFTLQGGPIAPWGNLSPVDFVARDLLFLAPVVAGLGLLWDSGRPTSFAYSLTIVLIAVCTTGTPAVGLPRYLAAAFPAIGAVGGQVRSGWAWATCAVAAAALATQGLAHHLYRYWS